MTNIPQSDGRPFRIVRINGQDIAVHIGSLSNDGSADFVDLGLQPTDRVGSKVELSPTSLSAVQLLRRVLQKQLETRSRALVLTMNGVSNREPKGTGHVTIDTREKLGEVLREIFDNGVDEYRYPQGAEGDRLHKMLPTVKRLIASAMKQACDPKEGRAEIADSKYYFASGSIPTVEGISVNDLKIVLEAVIHADRYEARIISLVEERGEYHLRMNLTVPSGKALKVKIDEWDRKNA